MEADDRQLVLKCREGSEEAYRLLLSRYEGYIYSLCYRFARNREDTLELTQESLIKIVAVLESYQVSRPFKPWLRRVVINVCLNFQRSRAPGMLSLDRASEEELSLKDILAEKSESDPLAHVEWLEIQDTLRITMERLPPPLRLVLALRHQEEMSYQEIADSTGLPIGTVKTYLYRGRALLRKALSNAYGWEGV
ncbi:RNA polymerase sigma factor [Pelotomaculum propionicicum]|uniref:ECF RNA polymerase sigma factor SigW n=1 Tax=Pelotomaculum propionicicum TaxID=258475 RepID=A0A4Y7RXL2_9FIRM|nr:sigma-70 family RNA polymerase sigma factor [Pelotomaculum propionicicum]NLI12708.1 sigma-70 family RNA polymerase sigma factor [Peptococcaceae bacterium]TEB13500.1 ECF RNA polymerase sigma factor SigW [Pelotomaculum propionicicum]